VATLSRIDFYDNNGWTNKLDADHAKRLVGKLLVEDFDGKVIIDHMLAHGHGRESLQRLQKIIDSFNRS
jgi:hypothetical protein